MSKFLMGFGILASAAAMACLWWTRDPLWLIGFVGGIFLQAFSVYMTEE